SPSAVDSFDGRRSVSCMDEAFLNDEYYLLIGRASVAFGMLEMGLDFIVASTFTGMGGHPNHPEIPRSLDKKIGYLRDISKMPQMRPWTDRTIDLADRLNELKHERHLLIHGT